MDTLDRSALDELAGHDGWPAISIYLPAHRAGNETVQDPLRLKNLLRDAEEDLVAGGMRTPDATSVLESARTLQADGAFWREGFDGLAIFLTPQTSRVFKTSHSFPEHMRLSSRFLVRPLIGALAPDLRFFILALSKNRVRILEGTAETVRELEPAGIPQGLADALKYDDYESHVQFHSRTPAAASGHGRRAAIFHGHGGSADTAKEDLMRYFRQVDRGLQELLGEKDVPLLLAGVDYLLPIYREASSYPLLVDAVISGNPDEARPETMHSEALELLKPHLNGEVEAALSAFAERRDGVGASADLRDIFPAALEGRVDTLLVTESGNAWGSYDPVTDSMTVRTEPVNGDVDLLDRAAAETLLHGGRVHVLSAEEIQQITGGSEAAAILRY